MTKMERPVFDKFNSATNYSLRILRAIEIIENRKLCWKVSKTYLKTSCNSKCDEFNIIAPNGRDKSTPQAACENLFVDRIATQIAPPFDSPTTLRVSLKTLRVIEMSKAVYLSRSHHEKIRRCRMLRPKPSAIGEASHRFAPGLARSPLRGTSSLALKVRFRSRSARSYDAARPLAWNEASHSTSTLRFAQSPFRRLQDVRKSW